ncbi:tetratricopeptide repeat protein [Kitasatospora sp. NPDC088391]|uniref:tetratricopeptide repeat protein n=1 Tax=Kitasatospora sp. NPDC088391 TaxID=3364074 RepID=UPI00381F7344
MGSIDEDGPEPLGTGSGMSIVASGSGSAAAHTIGEVHQHRHEHAAPRRTAVWPHQVGRIPPQAGAFQDRAEAQRLAVVLEGGGTAVVGGKAGGVRASGVLTGLGGVGKTQLAAEYARTAWSSGQLDVLVWITAVSGEAVAAGYAQAGTELLGAEPEGAAGAFLAWLEPKSGGRPCRWLVVLDDVADPDDLRGWWPPPSPHGRTLVTTRRRDAVLSGGGRRVVEVGLFTPDEAVAYLTDALAACGRTETEEELRALAADLGHLPLALSQAAAYLVDAGISCAAYRRLLADRTRTLADAAPGPLPDDQAHIAAAAWALSIEHADTLHPAGLARPMLHLAAFLDPNGIPQAVLTSTPALEHLTAAAHTDADDADAAVVTQAQAVAALRVLHRLGLITHDPATPHQAVRVHQLVQRAVRDTLHEEERERLTRTAADALLAAWPEIETDTALARALRANTDILHRPDVLVGHAPGALYRPDAHTVLFRAGRSLGESGRADAARDHFQALTDTTAHHLGPDHPDTLTTRHHLAHWRGQAGDAAGAAAALADLLADYLRVLGPDNPHTLNAQHNLAHWRGEAGDAAGAAAALADLLADRLRVLGPDNPDTLTTRGNLARWRGQAGDVAGATTAIADLLADYLRVLGPDRPDTLTIRHNLAHWRERAGNTAAADDE